MPNEILLNRVSYFLPLTRVRLHGTQTTKTSALGKRTVVSDVKAELVSCADPKHPRYITDADSLLADRQLVLEFTTKGLLSGTTAKSTGKLGQIVQSLFGAALRFSLFRSVPVRHTTLAAPGTEATLDDRYAQAFPDLAAARQSAKAAVGKLTKAVADVGQAIAAAASVEDAKKLHEKLTELVAALTAVKKEAEALETHFNAWKAGEEKTEVKTLDHLLDLGDLAEDATVRLLQAKTEDQIKQALPTTSRDLFWDLRLIVADAKLPAPVLPKEDGNPPLEEREDTRGIEFRTPRPGLLSVYAIQGEGTGTFTAVLKSRADVAILDEKCIASMLIVKAKPWTEKSLDIDFDSASGAVTKITSDAKGELVAFADMLSKLPGEALSALKDANAFMDERQKLALQETEQRIVELQKSKEEAVARIALNETLATEQQAAEIKRIDQEIALLQKQVQLSQLSGTSANDVQIKVLQIEEDLVKARAALEQAEIDRLKIQAALMNEKESGARG